MLNFNQIKKYLPQQFPLIMIDKVLEFEKGKRLTAIKNVSGNEYFFPGHFPDMAIMPGALILEGLGQCSIILFELTFGTLENDEIPLFASVQARFLKPVFPGDQLKYEVEIIKVTSYAGIFKGIATVDDQVVVKCQMSMGKQARSSLS